MLVSANVSKEVYRYYYGHDLDLVVDTLLEMFDMSNLPERTGERYKELRINVSNENYLEAYMHYGAKSKKVSLARLLEFGMKSDVLSMERFNLMRRVVEKVSKKNPVYSQLSKAYKALLMAREYDDSEELKIITNLVYDYRGVCQNETSEDKEI